MKLKTFVLPSLALGGAAMLLAPAPDLHGFSTIGGNLSLDQRDFRTRNTFADSTANDNQTPDAQFPGHQGAVMAIWKACVEWGTQHGNGQGDPTQPGGLGSGGANFDAVFQGEATGIGTTNNNIHSPISSCSGGVLAFTETPISNGWRIRYCENWTWQDGPSAPTFSQIDLQGVACHEYGHALGLGHTGVGGATMFPSISGSGASARSIASDDINGVRFVYGTASSAKPTITAVSLSGSTVTINGTNFSPSGNQVWFTNGSITATSVDPVVKVVSVVSTGGGTQIIVTVPASAGSGDVLVRKNGTSHSSLSNAWPLDTGGGPGGGLQITSVVPSSIEAVNPGTTQFMTINGSGFTPTTRIFVDGIELNAIFPAPITFVSSGQITFAPPLMSKLGAVEVKVQEGVTSATGSITVTANDPPSIEVNNGDQPVILFSFGGADVTMGSAPGNIFFLAASPDLIPSVLPGFLSVDIGNNFASLVTIGNGFTIPAKGYVTVNLPLNLAPLTTFYMEGIVLDTSFTLPLPDSNEQEVQFLF